jgi:cobalt-zinc-cadmium efflux system membrane fusion protein
MYFSALIETNSQTVPTLPLRAFVSFDNKDFIFVAKDDTSRQYEMTEVRKGNSENDFAEVILPDGFQSHSRVVVDGAYELLSFLKNTGE